MMAAKIRLTMLGLMLGASSGAFAQAQQAPIQAPSGAPVQDTLTNDAADQAIQPQATPDSPDAATTQEDLLNPQLRSAPAPTPQAQLPAAPSVPADVSVADRTRPDFDPAGLIVGAFQIFPSIELTPAYADNIFAGTVKAGDASITAVPEIKFKSLYSRNSLSGRAYFSRREYDKYDTESASQYGAQLEGVLDITRRSRFRFSAGGDHLVEDRYNINTVPTTSPVRYDRLIVNAEYVQEFNYLRFIVSANAQKYNYSGAAQAYRDLTIYGGEGRVEYEFRPGLKALARVVYDKRSYDNLTTIIPLPPSAPFTISRDSEGWRFEGGFAFEVTQLLTGNVRVGYRKRTYDDNYFASSKGLAYGADILWSVTPLTSVRFSLDREIEETAEVIQAGNLRTEGRLTIDHELLRNLIITAYGRYATINPVDSTGSADEFEGKLSALLLLNRRLSFESGFRHTQRTTSSDPLTGLPDFSAPFKANYIFATIKFSL